jgi:hypothetical protein
MGAISHQHIDNVELPRREIASSVLLGDAMVWAGGYGNFRNPHELSPK